MRADVVVCGAGIAGVAAAYQGLLHRLVIDLADRDDAATMDGVEVLATPTLIKEPEEAARLASELVGS